jgi:hypothetical protein
MASSTTTGSAGFFNGSGSSAGFGKVTQPKENEFIQFKNIKESQVSASSFSSGGAAGYHGPKSYHIENSELLFKMLRFDNKLLRSLFEANGFTHTESHEWNVLWSSSSCKSYIYEGLNEYQKINHFPQSYEITRKDRLCYNMVRM